MAKRSSSLSGAAFEIDASAPTPLYRQLYHCIRDAVLDGRLRPGSRLPSTRDLAAELCVSRNTVLAAFESLIAEGFLEGETGLGTYVTRKLVRMPSGRAAREASATAAPLRGRSISDRGRRLVEAASAMAIRKRPERPFSACTPAYDRFPADVWARLAARKWRAGDPELMGYGDPLGYAPLREAIASYLGITRAVRCDAARVLITNGTQQSLDLVARLLLDVGDEVWVEEPGYSGARAALLAAGAKVVPVAVDDKGLDVAEGERCAPHARVAYVTPSHQYPLGITMSLERRLELLAWASRAGAWIVEDDYDSEFHVSGRPLAALQGLDTEERVVYFGTFSKVLCAGLGLGYLVVPKDLAPALASVRALAGRQVSHVEQAVLASFIDQGHFAAHLRRMRDLYAQRHRTLAEELEREVGDLVEVAPLQHGLSTVALFREQLDDQAVVREALELGVVVRPISSYFLERPRRAGLVLGHAAYSEEEIRDGVALLARAIRRAAHRGLSVCSGA